MKNRVALALCLALVAARSLHVNAQTGMPSGTPPTPLESLQLASSRPGQPVDAPTASGRQDSTQSSDGLPKWIGLGAQYRGRVEATRGLATVGGRDDSYYLNRLRLDTTLTPSPWLRGFLQLQDARVFGYGTGQAPRSHANSVDLRQGYVEVRRRSRAAVTLRVGRQELSYLDQRLIGTSDWSNTARSFDGARVIVAPAAGITVDGFAVRVVRIEPGRFDRWRTDEQVFGAAVTSDRMRSKSSVAAFLFAKISDVVEGESGVRGDAAIYTLGTRAAGTLPRGLDYGVEVALQRGHAAGDRQSSWAGHYRAGWLIPVGAPMRPRLTAEMNHASGDRDPRDGRRGTFDQFFPTNHSKYGIADQVGWRNMREVAVGLELYPVRAFKLLVDVHRFDLSTIADGLYNAAGVRTVLNRAADSRDVGREVDLQGTFTLGKAWTLSAGVSCLLPGRYLEQSSVARTMWTPYLMWTAKF
jgi:hypothetical protein